MKKTRTYRAFTLVELLVVIGIIALLISILLPTLNKARQQANSVACQANEHQMGLLLAEYAGENHGFLPFGYVTTPYANGADHYWNEMASEWSWCDTLTLLTNKQSMNTPGSYLSWAGIWVGNMAYDFNPIFHDKDVNSTAYANRASDYNCNPRLMPYNYATDGYMVNTNPSSPNLYFAQRNLGTIRQSASTILIWDTGVQLTGDGQDHGGPYVGSQIDCGQLNWTSYGTNLLNPAGDPRAQGNMGNPIGLGTGSPYYSSGVGRTAGWKQLLAQQNVDYTNPYYDNAADMRFRHMNNHNSNLLFVDGHVESRQLGDVVEYEICTNFVPTIPEPK